MPAHILTILGGAATLIGAAMTLWPALPKNLAYGLLAIGIVTLSVGVYQIIRAGPATNQALVEEQTGYVKMKLEGALYEILDAVNITSITDHGVGDFSVTFDKNLDSEDYYIDVSAAEGSIDYKVVSRERSGFRLQFSEYEPVLVRISWHQ